jgi:hypothetical protein
VVLELAGRVALVKVHVVHAEAAGGRGAEEVRAMEGGEALFQQVLSAVLSTQPERGERRILLMRMASAGHRLEATSAAQVTKGAWRPADAGRCPPSARRAGEEPVRQSGDPTVNRCRRVRTRTHDPGTRTARCGSSGSERDV